MKFSIYLNRRVFVMKVHWDEPQKKVFDSLKKALIVQPILKMADLSKPLDASNEGLGAVL